MPLTLHAALVPSFAQLLRSTLGLVGKAELFCAERGVPPAAIIDARLIEDMLPFAYQVKSVAVHSQGALEGVRAGLFSPDTAPPPDSFDGLRARIEGALAFVEGIAPEEMEGWTGRDMRFQVGDFRRDFAAEDFLLSFSQPNFYFHVTTAYALLRAGGVAVGKSDFLGRPRARA